MSSLGYKLTQALSGLSAIYIVTISDPGGASRLSTSDVLPCGMVSIPPINCGIHFQGLGHFAVQRLYDIRNARRFGH